MFVGALMGFAPSSATSAVPPRVPWATSHVVGSPDPPPRYRTRNLFPGVKLDHPVAVAMPAGDHRWWVAEQGGKVFRIDPAGDGEAVLALDLKTELAKRDQSLQPRIADALYGLAFPPDFEQRRVCYLAYTVVTGEPGRHLEDGTRVSRFNVTNNDPPTIDAESEEILITFLEGGHNGACLAFGPDGCLYISTGDGEGPSPPDIRGTGQDLSDLLSSILRIDVEHASEDHPYSIPIDNPFVGREGCRPEVWAYGLRNPWKMSFDQKTGDLWVGDVGWELWEMIHRVERGGNYGWSVVEGRQPVGAETDAGLAPISPPIIELPHTMAASITGGFVYRGHQFPELQGRYIFGDWETKRIWSWPVDRLEGAPAAEEPKLTDLVDPSLRIISFGEDQAGELCVLDYDAGTLNGFERNAAADLPQPKFPTKLSETGLFDSTAEHQPAVGVIPFEVRAAQWSDGAAAERFLALPGDGRIVWHPDSAEVRGSMFRRHLDFPENAVLMKTLSLPADKFRPQPRRIETQLLHYDGQEWRGYSYRWDDSQQDAKLVAAEGDEADFPIEVPGAPEDRRTLRWTFASRTQCMVCHNPWAETTLAFNLDQLGRDEGDSTSTWDEFCELGLIQAPEELRDAAKRNDGSRFASRLVNPFDESRPIEQRARSYLHANCAHCHRNGGGGSVQVELQIELDLKAMKAIDVPPVQGTLGLEEGRLIAPGDPFRSVLLLRMAKTGRGRMPHLASERPHESAVTLIAEWISEMSPGAESSAGNKAQSALRSASKKPVGPERRGIIAGEVAASTSSAMAMSRAIESPDVPEELRIEVANAADALGDPVIHDLFTKYLPEPPADRVGAVPHPQRILSRQGDARQGKSLFWNSTTLNCKTCHRVGEEGGQVGPELARIVGKRSRAELLGSLLDPSRSIEPEYASFTVQTTDGRALSGVVVKRDAETIQLRDAKNEEISVPMADVEAIRPQRASLMPEGLLRDLSVDEAADLLAYLESLRSLVVD